MHIVTQALSAAGRGPFIPVNKREKNWGLGLGVNLSSGATLTFGVEYSMNDPVSNRSDTFSISRTTTTATVTRIAHRLKVNDEVTFTGCGAPFDGTFVVASVVDADNFTYTVPNSGAASSSYGTGFMTFARFFTHATITGKTADFADSLFIPCTMVRLAITAYTSGTASLHIVQTS